VSPRRARITLLLIDAVILILIMWASGLLLSLAIFGSLIVLAGFFLLFVWLYERAEL
jgi:hypothetical protein